MMLDLRRVHTFVAVAEELHFGRAARRLGIVQPAVSQHIRHLEDEIGTPLLVRTSKRVGLTEAGRVFLADARRLLRESETAKETARRAGAGETGSLRVGFIDSVTWSLVPTLVRAFRKRHPGVTLAIASMSRREQAEALARGELDAALLPEPVDGKDFLLTRLAEAPLIAALAPRHPLATNRSIDIGSLAGEPFLFFPPQNLTRLVELAFEACARAGFVPRVVQELRELDTILALVSAGVGVTLLPAWFRGHVRPGVAYRTLRVPRGAPRFAVTLATRAGDERAALAAFVAVAREVAAKADHRRP